jgi:hypothetical protein
MDMLLSKFSNRQRKQVEARWREWLPAMTFRARETPDPSAKLEVYRLTYFRRMRILLDAGMRWESIHRGRLDDPEVGEEVFKIKLETFLRRCVRRGFQPRARHAPHAFGQDFEKRYADELETIT